MIIFIIVTLAVLVL